MTDSDNALVRIYTERFGDPFTTDEVYGYWLFVAGAILAIIGIGLFFLTTSGGRQVPYLLAATGLVGVVTGLVISQSLHKRAKQAIAIGVVICVLALVWFLTVFPTEWTTASGVARSVIGVYTLGLAIVAGVGAIGPLAVGQSQARAAAQADLEQARTAASDHEATIDELESERDSLRQKVTQLESEHETAAADAETAAEELQALTTRLERYESSSGTFDVYRDAANEWRWRLVHQNGNIIATSGEGYSSDRSARRGMQSVKRNAPAATVVWQRDETDPEPEQDPVITDPQSNFELYQDASEEYRWRLRHDNGNVLAAATRGFSSKQAATDGIEAVKGYIGPADYLEFDPAGIEVYEDAAEEWRWRLIHRNGTILADASEGYSSRSNAVRAADRFQEVAGDDDTEFEPFEDAAGEYRWRLRADNGEIVADPARGYTDASDRDRAVERIREYAPAADRLSMTDAAVEIHEDTSGEFRWRLRHRNGTILATSGEGYTERSKAVNAVNRVKRHAPNAPTESETV